MVSGILVQTRKSVLHNDSAAAESVLTAEGEVDILQDKIIRYMSTMFT